ncbi:unnamed protein product [Vicia faba]|uniref:Uncharacterized protein n=1 Tax=Vicia faba TaxID=3906 RepID=A0AAV1BA31_VICFA|nr:unnamed protein product [Vicia faba]
MEEKMIAYEEEEMPKLSSYQSHHSCFIRDVYYSCGSCGYELNLNSSNRNTNTTSLIDSSYGRSIKKRKRSLISFFSVDETRFTHIQQFSFSWISFFNFQPTVTATKLLCRNCGNHLGYARTFPPHSRSNSWDGISDSRNFYIKLNAIQPSS